jgi:hypothetical protein
MLIPVRTTLVIDDHVLREAKRHAIEVGLSMSEFTTLALRETLRDRHRPTRRTRFSLPTYGTGPKQDSPTRQIADLRDEGR